MENRAQTAAAQERLHVRAGTAKVVLVATGLVTARLALGEELFSLYWLLVPIGLFAAMVIYHERVLRARARANIAAEFYRKGIRRIEDRWSGTGESGEQFRDAKHPYADDLDIFGTGCLFELLCTARMPMGQSRLAQWLSSAWPVTEIIERQESVAELRDKLDLRERLAVTGETLRSRLNPEALISWAEGKAGAPANSLAFRGLRLGAALFAAAVLVALGDFLATRNFWPLVIVLIAEAIFRQWLRDDADTGIQAIACNADGLALFSRVLDRLEHEPFHSARWEAVIAKLRRDSPPASRCVSRLARIVYWIDGRGGMLGGLLDLPCSLRFRPILRRRRGGGNGARGCAGGLTRRRKWKRCFHRRDMRMSIPMIPSPNSQTWPTSGRLIGDPPIAWLFSMAGSWGIRLSRGHSACETPCGWTKTRRCCW
jgi:hypothetical protein